MCPKIKRKSIFDLKKETFFLFLFWTVVIMVSLFTNLYNNKKGMLKLARIHALVAFEKDVVYRHWNASHGGVYVPITENTPTNPYLDLEEKNVETLSGKKLTMLNPSYMTRQVHELESEHTIVRGHITSLNPIRPENKPDEWEKEALEKFEAGESEVFSISDIQGTSYLRFMRPLFAEKSCLKCHAKQGYVEGDLRGGISVSVPSGPLENISRDNKNLFIIVHCLLWLIGIIGINKYYKKTISHIKKRNKVEEELKAAKDKLEEYNKDLEKMVEEKVKQLEKAQNSLLQKEKLASLGQLAAGVVHELNNPLAGVLSVIRSFKTNKKLNAEENELLLDMQKACEHMTVVIKSLNLYSRQSDEDREKLNCNDVIEETLAFSLSQLKSKGIALEKNLSTDLAQIFANKHQVQQIIINMISNAKDAMSRNGVFSITTKNVAIVGDDFVEIIFADSGVGIKKEFLAKIFNPFFTSKGKGEGVGLGLSIVHSIVENHNGQIMVDSIEGKGTVFTIRFPQSTDD